MQVVFPCFLARLDQLNNIFDFFSYRVSHVTYCTINVQLYIVQTLVVYIRELYTRSPQKR